MVREQVDEYGFMEVGKPDIVLFVLYGDLDKNNDRLRATSSLLC